MLTIVYEDMVVNVSGMADWEVRELAEHDIQEIKNLLFFKKELKKHLTK